MDERDYKAMNEELKQQSYLGAEKELKDILECLMKYTSDGDKEQDDRYLEVIEMDLVAYFKLVFRKPSCSNNKCKCKDSINFNRLLCPICSPS